MLSRIQVVVVIVVGEIDIVIDANRGRRWWGRGWLRSIG